MSNILHEKVLHEYERKRKENKQAYEKKLQEFYECFPSIKQIDDKISALAIAHAARIISEGITPEEAVAAVQKERNELEMRKKTLLDEYACTQPEIEYDCSLCMDTGLVSGQKCKCYMDIMHKLMLSGINGTRNLAFDVYKNTFQNFSLEWYSKTATDTALNVSPYENMKSVYAECRLFCSNFENDKKNLYFYGASGTGKTFMANCIANELLSNGYNVLYQSAYKLFQFMEDYKFGKIARDGDMLEDIYNSDLLIIDDLGTEFSTAYTCSVFFDILNTRLLNNKSTIISSNLSLNNLEKKYTERIQSRIIGNFEIMRFMGDDIRILKKQSRR